jgi:ATP-dependent DNA ligase
MLISPLCHLQPIGSLATMPRRQTSYVAVASPHYSRVSAEIAPTFCPYTSGMPRHKNKTGAPTFVQPTAALVVEKLPERPEWLYELKFDGYRALLIKDEEIVRLHSRKDKDLTAMYPGILAAGERLDLLVLDG